MDLKQLRYLCLVSEELSFTRAAGRAHTAQPALSRQIRRLEDELGVPLVDRTSRHVRMTPEGVGLVERARRILADVDDARAALSRTATLVDGRLTVGVTQTPGPLDVAELLHGYHRQHCGVDLVVREGLSRVITDWLRADEIDVGIVTSVPEPLRRELALVPIATECLVLVVACEHWAADRDHVELAEVVDEPFVLFPEGATIRDTFLARAAKLDLWPRVAFESTDPARVRSIVSKGLAVGVLPASDATRPGPEVSSVALAGPSPLLHEVFVARRARRRASRAAHAFISLAGTAA